MNKELHHQKRMRAEKRFKWYGKMALGVALALLFLLLANIIGRGVAGFTQTQVKFAVTFDEKFLNFEPGQTALDVAPARFNVLWQNALKTAFPDADVMPLYKTLGGGAGLLLKRQLEKEPGLLGKTVDVWFPLSTGIDEDRLKILKDRGDIRTRFNSSFFTEGDSRSPENAGLLGALVGSFFTMVTCLLVAFPLGVMSAVYLEEFAKHGRWVDLLEVNINNLAAVPSIVFGLLGVAVYINLMHMPRSASLVGGLTLALMVLPIIIISTRSSLKSVPPSIRHAALALGASKLQMVWHHTLPLAMPGVMTGTILGMARAIGETAPLLMIGMVAFVADIPSGFTSAATVMPVQIFLWAGSPETGFAQKTQSAILVLLVILLGMNALAIYLRKKFEVRW